jgi:predicted  nucleic acid-binding Zn-ribbon protein
MSHQEVVSILDLQNLDLELMRIKSETEAIPAEIKKIEDTIALEQKQQKTFEEEFKKQNLAQKALEGEIQTKKEQIKKYESQLNAVKKNDEYTKLLNEIAAVKEQIRGIEEQTIVLMEKVEVGDQEIASRRTHMNAEIKNGQEAIAEKKKTSQALHTKLETLISQRTTQAKKCQGSLYPLYEKFMQKKQTIALVPVEKNGSCGGCRRALPPNIKNEVMKGKIIQCETCSRLLFWVSADMEAHLSRVSVETP